MAYSPSTFGSPLGPGRRMRQRSPPFRIAPDLGIAPPSDPAGSTAPAPGMGAAASAFAALPADHFLSRPRVALAQEGLAGPSARPDLTTLAGADYDVDVRSGFLPPAPPLARLPPGPWQVWEDAWDATDGLRAGQGEARNVKTKEWRTAVREKLPVVDVRPLSMAVEPLRRAHALLAFLTHAYVHSAEAVPEGAAAEEVVVPKALAVPLCAVSELLDVPPVLSYADTVLYNWRLKDPAMGFTPRFDVRHSRLSILYSRSLSRHSNIDIPLTFTRMPSEAHFFRTSFIIETLGPACLSLMRSSLDEAFLADALSVTRITENLCQLASLIDRLRQIVETMREGCEPRIFYWEIRPWFNGGKWTMEGVSPRKQDAEVGAGGWRVAEFGGPSAGQSTLIHALDVFLGVDHRPRPSEAVPVASASSSPRSKASMLPDPTKEETFMNRMAAYMPHHHRRFLEHLSTSLSPSSSPRSFPHLASPSYSVRSLAAASPSRSALRAAYDGAVSALEGLRKSHSKVALLYIISQSRVEPPEGSAFWESWRQKMEQEWQRGEARRTGAPVSVDADGGETAHKGTGGTDLSKFLKRCRERTVEALLGDGAF